MTMPLFAHMAPLCRPGSQWRGRGRQRTRQLTVAQPMFVPASRMDRQLFATHPMFVAASGMDRQPLPFAPDSPFAGCERQLPRQRQISPGGWWGQGRTLVWVWMEECQFSVQFVSKTFSRGVSGRRTRSDKAWSGDGREGDAAERDGDARRQHPRHPARAALAPAARRRLVALPTAVGRLELHEARLALAPAQGGLRERA